VSKISVCKKYLKTVSIKCLYKSLTSVEITEVGSSLHRPHFMAIAVRTSDTWLGTAQNGHMAQKQKRRRKTAHGSVRGPDTLQMKNHSVYLEAYIGKKAVSLLVDTGCEGSVTLRSAFLEPADCRLFAADGEKCSKRIFLGLYRQSVSYQTVIPLA